MIDNFGSFFAGSLGIKKTVGKYDVSMSANGQEIWLYKGKCHREDGPAFIHARGDKTWYLHGEPFDSEEEHKIEMRKLKLKALGI